MSDGKRYQTIIADPPWPYRWSGDDTQRGGTKYPTLGIMQIAELPVRDFAADQAHLYLWITPEFNWRGEGSRIAAHWGFNTVGEIIWRKPHFGMGRFPRAQHEILLVGRRGGLPFQVNDVGSVQAWPRGRHSEKPDAAVDMIERASPGPYLELFARRARFGWDYWGDESLNTVELPKAVA
jgi:N6-adenosine-specific RNA methylase IME4